MKFLVIGKSNGAGASSGFTATNAQEGIESLKSVIGGKQVEQAYALVAGGYALVVNVEGVEELTVVVRSNPFFKSCYTEIIPIADAVDFVEGFLKYTA